MNVRASINIVLAHSTVITSMTVVRYTRLLVAMHSLREWTSEPVCTQVEQQVCIETGYILMFEWYFRVAVYGPVAGVAIRHIEKIYGL